MLLMMPEEKPVFFVVQLHTTPFVALDEHIP
jgi:hypothetical protein